MSFSRLYLGIFCFSFVPILSDFVRLVVGGQPYFGRSWAAQFDRSWSLWLTQQPLSPPLFLLYAWDPCLVGRWTVCLFWDCEHSRNSIVGGSSPMQVNVTFWSPMTMMMSRWSYLLGRLRRWRRPSRPSSAYLAIFVSPTGEEHNVSSRTVLFEASWSHHFIFATILRTCSWLSSWTCGIMWTLS